MSTGTATKTCRKCGEAKSTSEFHKHANGKGGLHSECKECTKARVRAYYHANRERALARKAEYRRAHPARTNTQRKEHQRGTSPLCVRAVHVAIGVRDLAARRPVRLGLAAAVEGWPVWPLRPSDIPSTGPTVSWLRVAAKELPPCERPR